MDLIQQLSQAVGVDGDQAQALAGKALGMVRDRVAEGDEGAAKELESAVPELGGWEEKAKSAMGGGGLGGLLGAAAGALGGDDAEDTAAIVAILAKFDIDGAKAALVAPILLGFLEKRLGEDTLGKVLKFAPLLSGGGGSTEDSGIGGLLGKAGSLFG
jgi:hypothetical protein